MSDTMGILYILANNSVCIVNVTLTGYIPNNLYV